MKEAARFTRAASWTVALCCPVALRQPAMPRRLRRFSNW